MQVSKSLRAWILFGVIIWLIVFWFISVRAEVAEIIYQGTEVVDPGEAPFNVYYIDCGSGVDTSTKVSVEITYLDDFVETRLEPCTAKMYVSSKLHIGVLIHADGTHAVVAVGMISAPATPEPTATTTLEPPSATATATLTPTAEATSIPLPTSTPYATPRVKDSTVYLPVVMR